MSSVVISGDTSGAITLAVPAISGTNTATLPAATGTVMVSGNMPAFSAYQNSAQTIGSSAFTKVQLQAEEFDTANCFDSTTNYRFTPNVAGYYQVSGAITNNNTSGNSLASIYKNGAEYKRGNFFTNGANGVTSGVSALVYLNGTTDYVELFAFINIGGTLSASLVFTYFQASMVRAA